MKKLIFSLLGLFATTFSFNLFSADTTGTVFQRQSTVPLSAEMLRPAACPTESANQFSLSILTVVVGPSGKNAAFTLEGSPRKFSAMAHSD